MINAKRGDVLTFSKQYYDSVINTIRVKCQNKNMSQTIGILGEYLAAEYMPASVKHHAHPLSNQHDKFDFVEIQDLKKLGDAKTATQEPGNRKNSLNREETAYWDERIPDGYSVKIISLASLYDIILPYGEDVAVNTLIVSESIQLEKAKEKLFSDAKNGIFKVLVLGVFDYDQLKSHGMIKEIKYEPFFEPEKCEHLNLI